MKSRPGSTRRSFLKLGTAGLGLAACPQIMTSGALFGANPASRRLNVAIIGCGNRSRTLIPSVLQEGHNFVAMCDVDPNQIARLKSGASDGKKKKGADFSSGLAKAKPYADFRRLLEGEKNLDAVIICAGQRWHMPMSRAVLLSGRHVFCEKPLAHSVAEARAIATMMQGNGGKLVTQIGTQGGATDAFRRSMEIMQAGLLGQIREVHCWMNRTFPPSEALATVADAMPAGLNWDAWCGPAPVHPFKTYYLGGCLQWGRWLDYGDGHLADMGAHAHNLPLRALELGPPLRIAVNSAEPVKDSYPSRNDFRWDFAARGKFAPVTVWWHDGPDAVPPPDLTRDVVATYGKVPTNGCLFVGEKGMLVSDAWGQRGVMRLKTDSSPKCRGVLDHEEAKALPVIYPRAPEQNHMKEWLNACRGEGKTFQDFAVAARAAEFGMTGIVALRAGRELEWDSVNLKAKNCPEADRWIHLPQRQKWIT